MAPSIRAIHYQQNNELFVWFEGQRFARVVSKRTLRELNKGVRRVSNKNLSRDELVAIKDKIDRGEVPRILTNVKSKEDYDSELNLLKNRGVKNSRDMFALVVARNRISAYKKDAPDYIERESPFWAPLVCVVFFLASIGLLFTPLSLWWAALAFVLSLVFCWMGADPDFKSLVKSSYGVESKYRKGINARVNIAQEERLIESRKALMESQEAARKVESEKTIKQDETAKLIESELSQIPESIRGRLK